MFAPTSISATSIDTISNAVCESSALCSTACEIRLGLASTSVWCSAEPMALTMPSPTRAMIVSSRGAADQPVELGPHRDAARALSWMPFLQTPSSVSFGPWSGRGSR